MVDERDHGPVLADPRLDHLLRGLIARTAAAFPGRIAAWYVEGSHADCTAIATSDLDLLVVFDDSFRTDEQEQATTFLREQATHVGLALDAEVVDAAGLGDGITPMFRDGARLVAGTELRDRFPLIPLARWTRERMHIAYYLALTVYGRSTPVHAPLSYPDTDAPGRGYANRDVTLPDGAVVPSTRNLIRVTGWMASALLALDAGQYVARKRDCHILYARHIGDEWTSLLADLYQRCRGEWQGLIPADAVARAAFNTLCARTLAFENYFLTRYAAFVATDLCSQAPERALWVLARLPLCNAGVHVALEHLLTAAGPHAAAADRTYQLVRGACAGAAAGGG